MRTIKIFLASSAELNADKEQVELFISRKNKDFNKKRLFLELSTWKDFISAMTEEHSQEKYNQYIRSCDIALFLFHTQLGRFTKAEFDTAHLAFLNSTGHFKKPLIYTFFMNDKNETTEISDFRSYIDSMDHFYDTYNSPEDLFVKLNRQLDKLENQGAIKGEAIDTPKIIKYAVYYFLLPLLVLGGAILAWYYYQPGNLTVRVKEVRSIPGLSFQEGTIILTYGDKTETLKIKEEVIFKQIPSKYKRESLKLSFAAPGYQKMDTLINLGNLMVLPIKRDNSLGIIFGSVHDEENLPVQDVSISVKDLQTKTDANGTFRINIPIEKQAEEQRLTAYKPGYQVWDFSGVPSQTIEWKIMLLKLTK
ncbi:MAG: carboxypeptidase-like regulatory domain-containing protein [Bacteroidetes bacterium]|nr:carboxypeptidase-like regulatory domain-containing protein [Bacteroidota bacterium]